MKIMTYSIKAPAKLKARVKLPASKSVSNRALMIHALTPGCPMPENLSDCDDTMAMLKAVSQKEEVIDIGAAGTAMRFMTALLSVGKGEHVITGTERMKHRPIGILVDALRYLGADIEYLGEEGFPPLRIKGRTLRGGSLEIAGNVSSQYISALLMIAPVMADGLRLKLTGNIVSRPYIELTMWMMGEYGADVSWTSPDTIEVRPKAYEARNYVVENDWSAASYWYEALALCNDQSSEVVLEGLMDSSYQGDTVVKYLFALMGVKTVFGTKQPLTPTTVTLKKLGSVIPRLEYDFTSSPDLAQTMVVTCAVKGVPFHFNGLSSLRIKETDRITALQKEMRKIGYEIEAVGDDQLVWDGNHNMVIADPIDTYEDHRMAMAFAPVACGGDEILVNNPQVVTKSYPTFWDDLRSAGFSINELP